MKRTKTLFIALMALATTPALAPAEGLFDCIATPSKVTDVSAATSGRIAAVHVDRSDIVEAGQAVAELDAEVEHAAVKVAEARARMGAEIELGKINVAFGEQRKDRLQSLYHRKVASNQDLDEAERDAALAEWNLQQARDVYRLRQLELVRSQALLGQRTVSSPVSGVVLERYKNSGEFVEDQPIVRIAQLNPLHVETIVPMSLFDKINQGDSADVILNATDGASHRATVSAVDRVGDPAAGTFGVRLELPNPESKLPAGVKCQVEFRGGAPAQATLDQTDPEFFAFEAGESGDSGE